MMFSIKDFFIFCALWLKLLAMALVEIKAECIFIGRPFSQNNSWSSYLVHRGGSRTAATCKVELFLIIVSGFQPLTIITKSSTLDVAAVVDPPLIMASDWTLPSQHLIVQIQIWKHQNNVWNLLKFHIKGTGKTPLTSFWWLCC